MVVVVVVVVVYLSICLSASLKMNVCMHACMDGCTYVCMAHNKSILEMLPTAAPDGPPQRPGRPGRPARHRCRQRRRPTRLPVPAAIASSAGKPHGKPCGSGGSRNIGSGLKLCEKLYEIMSDWIMFNCDLFVCCHLLILSVNLVWPQWVQNGPKP